MKKRCEKEEGIIKRLNINKVDDNNPRTNYIKKINYNINYKY